MKVLVACEFSGIVREAFKARGHDAWSCDYLDTEIPGQHIKGDVLGILNDGWDLMIAHPDCTYLANSGVRWLIDNPERKKKMIEAAYFFRALIYNVNIPQICVENPIPHKYAREFIPNYNQIIHPWQFGHTTRKATCLWLKNLPPLLYKYVAPEFLKTDEIHKEPPGPDRKKNRSRTFPGIANAMAEQWG